MNWYDDIPESKECTCRYCGEESYEDFCSRDCLIAYKHDN